MKRVLIAKLSSLGDIVHTFPALSDAAAACPGVEFDWLVDEAFAEVASLHPAVRCVITIGLRGLRDTLPGSLTSAAPWRLRRELRAARYDLVIDAQGLLKSALVARLAGARVAGFDRASARESLAALGYGERHHVPRGRHAIDRLRMLFAAALGYAAPSGPARFGLSRAAGGGAVLLLHGSSWPSKAWPVAFWRALAQRLLSRGCEVGLPHADEFERARAHRIAAGTGARVMPRENLAGMVREVCSARAVIGVDSGLMHLAAAAGVPTVGLYGSTDPLATGARGSRARTVRAASPLPCMPCAARRCRLGGVPDDVPACMVALTVPQVWEQLERVLEA